MSEKFKQTGSVRKYYNTETVRTLARPQRTVRKYLNADALLEAVKKDFQKIPDHRAENTKISLDDALMSAREHYAPVPIRNFMDNKAFQTTLCHF